jgi:hypothetical protein
LVPNRLGYRGFHCRAIGTALNHHMPPDEVSKPDPATLSERQIADHPAKVYERTARVFEDSAAIAERIAERQERSGRGEAAEHERRAARCATCSVARWRTTHKHLILGQAP